MAISIEGLDYVKDGQPWCKITARTDIDVSGMDWVKDGQPWAVFEAFESGPGDEGGDEFYIEYRRRRR